MNIPAWIHHNHPDHDIGELVQTGFSEVFGMALTPICVAGIIAHFRHPKAIAILLEWLGAASQNDSLPSRTQEEHLKIGEGV